MVRGLANSSMFAIGIIILVLAMSISIAVYSTIKDSTHYVINDMLQNSIIPFENSILSLHEERLSTTELTEIIRWILEEDLSVLVYYSASKWQIFGHNWNNSFSGNVPYFSDISLVPDNSDKRTVRGVSSTFNAQYATSEDIAINRSTIMEHISRFVDSVRMTSMFDIYVMQDDSQAILGIIAKLVN